MDLNRLSLLILVVSIYLFLIQDLLSALDGFSLQPNIVNRYGRRGMSFWGHYQMYSAGLLLGPTAAYLSDQYSAQWTIFQALGIAALAVMVSGYLVLIVYRRMGKEIPMCHAHDGKVTGAGYWLLVQMTLLLTVFALFFFFTIARPWDVACVSAVLVVHMFADLLTIKFTLREPIVWRKQWQLFVGLAAIALAAAYQLCVR